MANNDNNKLHTSSTCTAPAPWLQRKRLESWGRCTALRRRHLWGCDGAWDVPVRLTIGASDFQNHREQDLRPLKREFAFSCNTNDQVCLVVINFELLSLMLLTLCKYRGAGLEKSQSALGGVESWWSCGWFTKCPQTMNIMWGLYNRV